MKLILSQCRDLTETEVEIRYAEMNDQIRSLTRRIEQDEDYLYGEENGRQYRILTTDILYVERVERKTFIYTQALVYRTEYTLSQLLDQLAAAAFVQVSRTCILNINVLENIKTLPSSRMEGTLSNGERITVSRTFLPGIKAVFKRKGSSGND